MCDMENEILNELEGIRRRFIRKCMQGEITEQELNERLNTIDRLSEIVRGKTNDKKKSRWGA